MNDFRLKIVKRRWIFVSLDFIAVIIILLSYRHQTYTNDGIQGLRVGVCIGIELVFIKQIQIILKALKNDDNLRKFYIEENDERKKLIMQQTGSIGYDIAFVGVIVAMIVSSFFNMVVCTTLLFATLFLCIIKISLKFYYRKKY